MSNIQPLGNRILVSPDAAGEFSVGGIALPANSIERPQQGTVVAVGEGRLLDSGQRVSLDIEVGQTVLFAKYSGHEVTEDGKKYLILDESSLFAIKE